MRYRCVQILQFFGGGRRVKSPHSPLIDKDRVSLCLRLFKYKSSSMFEILSEEEHRALEYYKGQILRKPLPKFSL